MTNQYHVFFINEIRRRLITECQERTLKCLDLLTEEEIWYRPNAESNSIGNLVLHLCGNVRQWLHSTIGGEKDIRRRQEEFDTQGPIPASRLKDMLEEVMSKSEKILQNCSVEDLLKIYRVQGFDENGVAILIHITEHFSYHVGQMTYFVKAHKAMDIGFYKDQDLDSTS